MKRLHDLEVAEVSLVPRGANKRKFLITKSDEKSEEKEMADKKEASARQSPEKIKEEHHVVAMKAAKAAAKKAYADAVHKLGYQKYPEGESTQKAMDDCEKAAKKADNEEEDEMEVDKTGVQKSDLDGVPESLKPTLDKIFKAQAELVKKNEELAASNETLSKELSMVKKQSRRVDFVAKAAGFKHLGVPVEELSETLMVLADKAPELVEKVEKMLSSADEQISKGNLFKELGSTQSGKVGPSYEAIEKAAASWVQKSGETLTKEQSVEKYLQTAEGKAMYNDYMAEHPSQKRS